MSILNPHKIFISTSSQYIIPTCCLRDTRMCLVPKHMFHAHLESDSTDQTDILGSTSRVYIRQFAVGSRY